MTSPRTWWIRFPPGTPSSPGTPFGTPSRSPPSTPSRTPFGTPFGTPSIHAARHGRNATGCSGGAEISSGITIGCTGAVATSTDSTGWRLAARAAAAARRPAAAARGRERSSPGSKARPPDRSSSTARPRHQPERRRERRARPTRTERGSSTDAATRGVSVRTCRCRRPDVASGSRRLEDESPRSSR